MIELSILFQYTLAYILAEKGYKYALIAFIVPWFVWFKAF